MAVVLAEDEIDKELETKSDWHVSDGKLCARFQFADFKTAMAFVTMVSIESEKQNHHPGWSNSWNVVEFAYCTHDVGDKITDLDFKLANSISEFAAKLSGTASK